MAACSLCGLEADLDPVNAGRDLGTVHRACFIAMDERDELEERLQVDALYFIAGLPQRLPRHVSREARW